MQLLKQPFKQRHWNYSGRKETYYDGTILNKYTKVVHACRTFEGIREYDKALCGSDYFLRGIKINKKGKISDVTCKKCKQILIKYRLEPDWRI